MKTYYVVTAERDNGIVDEKHTYTDINQARTEYEKQLKYCSPCQLRIRLLTVEETVTMDSGPAVDFIPESKNEKAVKEKS